MTLFVTAQGTSKVAVSHGNKRLKRIARLEATSENRHWMCGRDMLGQTVPSTDSSNREGLITDGGQPCMTDIQWQWGSRSKASPGLEISHILELIGEIRRCCPVQTLVHTNSKLELNPVWCSQPVQLVQERSDVTQTRTGHCAIVPWHMRPLGYMIHLEWIRLESNNMVHWSKYQCMHLRDLCWYICFDQELISYC